MTLLVRFLLFFALPCVKNNAGSTDLFELTDELASCALVIGNDTGSIHLANMVGTPVLVLFGPTNSIKPNLFLNQDAQCYIVPQMI